MAPLPTLSPTAALETFTVRETFVTGEACVCGDCHGRFHSYYIIEGKRGRQTRRRATESWCPLCGCRREEGQLVPCAQYHRHPQTGIRFQPGGPHAASVLRLEPVAVARLQKLFPDENPLSKRMRLVAVEVGLYTHLRTLFPDQTLDWLLTLRCTLVPARCPRCGRGLPGLAVDGEVEEAAAAGREMAVPVSPQPQARLLRHRGRWWREEKRPAHLTLF